MPEPPPDNISRLAEKWLNGTISPEEKTVLDQWYQQQLLSENEWSPEMAPDMLKEKIFSSIQTRIHAEAGGARLTRIRKWYAVAAAACVLAVVALVYNFAVNSTVPAEQFVELPAKAPIEPGGNKAILTLASGELIVLDSAGTGNLASQGSTKVLKPADGELAYNAAGNNTGETFYNTITIPRGGQYRLLLPDGTRVWLNAASSLRFPAAFPADERVVELTGEAYFEVAQNKAKPFRVVSGGTEVRVLGTHFNVNAYENEDALRTTLLEGKVEISNKHTAGKPEKRVLKPGQQAAVTAGILVKEVDADAFVAWKDGIFQFNSANIQTVMRQLERWYNLSVEFRGAAISQHFSGSISRNVELAKVLQMLELTGAVKFEIMEGRKLIVHP